MHEGLADVSESLCKRRTIRKHPVSSVSSFAFGGRESVSLGRMTWPKWAGRQPSKADDRSQHGTKLHDEEVGACRGGGNRGFFVLRGRQKQEHDKGNSVKERKGVIA